MLADVRIDGEKVRAAREQRFLSQREVLRSYAALEGSEVLEEEQNPGESGSSLERLGMDRVRDLVAARNVSVVLLQDRDRFSRRPAYTYLLRREFEEHGCEPRSTAASSDRFGSGTQCRACCLGWPSEWSAQGLEPYWVSLRGSHSRLLEQIDSISSHLARPFAPVLHGYG